MESPAKRGASVFPEVAMTAFPVIELAHHYRVAPGTVGRWIWQDRIAGQPDPRDRRRKLYRLDDVQAAYDKRHGHGRD